jgi:hypothetical protein
VVEYFYLDEKDRWKISIDLRDEAWYFLVPVIKGTPVSIDEFIQYLNLLERNLEGCHPRHNPTIFLHGGILPGNAIARHKKVRSN